MSSLDSVQTRRPEEGSACRTASRARWTAARWSRAEQNLSKRPADESLERTRVTASHRGTGKEERRDAGDVLDGCGVRGQVTD
eukprot:1918133-Pleurochrysis_carterae.AAC.1